MPLPKAGRAINWLCYITVLLTLMRRKLLVLWLVPICPCFCHSSVVLHYTVNKGLCIVPLSPGKTMTLKPSI
jgi:hypothetical protein